MSKVSSRLFRFCITTLCDWLTKLAPLSQPMGIQTNPKILGGGGGKTPLPLPLLRACYTMPARKKRFYAICSDEFLPCFIGAKRKTPVMIIPVQLWLSKQMQFIIIVKSTFFQHSFVLHLLKVWRGTLNQTEYILSIITHRFNFYLFFFSRRY